MPWSEDLLESSIGGVPWYCQAVATQVGRRTTSKELPFRDTPVREDLGRRSRKYGITAMVIGPDYLAARDAIIAVLEAPGPHLFVHPWMGEVSVIIDEGSSLDIQESHAEGGWARFSVNFVESGDADGAKITISTSAALTVAANAAMSASAVDTKKKLNLSLGKVFGAAAAAVSKISGALLGAKRKVMGTLGVSQAAGLSDAIADLNSSVNKLLNTPDELLTTISGLVGSLKDLFTDSAASDDALDPFKVQAKKTRAEAAITMAQDLAALDATTPPPFEGGPVDEESVAAQKALGKFMKIAVVAQTINLFGGDLPLESASEAISSLEALGTLADDILLDTDTSDDLFGSMTDLRAALNTHLESLTADLPQIQEYTPPYAMPALILAFQTYGDPERDLEIVARNGVRDPNFIPGGVPLELLIDV